MSSLHLKVQTRWMWCWYTPAYPKFEKLREESQGSHRPALSTETLTQKRNVWDTKRRQKREYIDKFAFVLF